METLSIDIILILMAVAGVAGFIDAIAGGGGLIALPALLWAGIAPIEALATNKLQGSFGTATSSTRFLLNGEIKLKALKTAIIMTLVGSVSGTLAVQQIDSSILGKLIPGLMILFALYFTFSPRVGDQDAKQRISENLFGLIVGFGAGFYDGFFGPGAGTFFTIGFVLLLGFNLRKATAGTKILNFVSNISSLTFFALAGHVIWTLGIAMGFAQMVGAWIGAHMVIKHGSKLIKPLLITVSLIISIKLLLEA